MRATFLLLSALTLVAVLHLASAANGPDDLGQVSAQFFQRHCLDCHQGPDKKGDLDLTALSFAPDQAQNQALWIRIHDRIAAGEMPPPEAGSIPVEQTQQYLSALSSQLEKLDRERIAREGRSTRRRMNRYEYEHTLRDLLAAPWLQIKQMLPEDGEAYRFNKVGEALDVSHVQIARYMAAADSALRQVWEASHQVRIASAQPKAADQLNRFYARDSRGFNRKIRYSVFNRSPERATFPIVGFEADLAALEEDAPFSVGDADPARRELEAMGVVASSYEPIEIKFDQFKAPHSGKYRLRFNAFSFWAGPESPEKWWRPSRTDISPGRTQEPVSVYAERPPRQLRKLGTFEVTPEPGVVEMEVYLLEGETVRVDAVRLFRSRPPGPWRNPLAEKDGQPGVAFRWLETSGPLESDDTSAGYRMLFDNFPLKLVGKQVLVDCDHPEAESLRLLERFMQRAYRRPVNTGELERFARVLKRATESGLPFHEVMFAGYSAVLCSPEFVTLSEQPGALDDYAVAARLAYFLTNSAPDQTLRELAAQGQLRDREVLHQQTERLLNDPRVQRFASAFLDYWLDLRKADATSPDADLYPDYYLDDYLVESAVEETQAFFSELLQQNMPARNLIDASFVMVNQRLAEHYGLENVRGIALRRVDLPAGHVRGGLLTQASVLKVTANGTTTSPVVRGVWITERILGLPVPPPPAAVPAVEPDTRGATTIREQLEKHRTLESCNACHARIDPPGFALECFDILGGYRDKYRVNNPAPIPDKKRMSADGYGKNGQPFNFSKGPVVDDAGQLVDGRTFDDVQGLKRLLLEDERQVARNLTHQLIVYATGAPVRFGDRAEVEAILDRAQPSQYGVRDLVHQIVHSELFLNK